MRTNRNTILHLVALGRITPAEAERLLTAWNDGREVFWVLAVWLAIVILPQLRLYEFLLGLVHAAHTLPSSGSNVVHRAPALITHLFGGSL